MTKSNNKNKYYKIKDNKIFEAIHADLLLVHLHKSLYLVINKTLTSSLDRVTRGW